MPIRNRFLMVVGAALTVGLIVLALRADAKCDYEGGIFIARVSVTEGPWSDNWRSTEEIVYLGGGEASGLPFEGVGGFGWMLEE